MPLAAGPHTVLVFTGMQFLGVFTRWGGVAGFFGYTANKDSQLLVVTEDELGNKTTRWFKLTKDQEVWVEDDVVHIPSLCLKSAPGDKTTCKG